MYNIQKGKEGLKLGRHECMCRITGRSKETYVVQAEYNSETISNKLTDAICLAPHSIDIVEQCQYN